MKLFYENFKFSLVLVVGLLIFSITGCNTGQQNQVKSYLIDSVVQTTAQRTIMPGLKPSIAINLYDLASYEALSYGKWSFGAPLQHITRTDIMPTTYSVATSTKKTKLLNFFTISDIHITDKEAPNQALYLSRLYKTMGISASLYSGVMLYTTHVLDAAVQTINSLHHDNPFDFGISLGDAANSTQYNETRWYIDVLDGKVITPSSGAHLGASSIEYQKPFKAAGLDKTIPWYQTLGNHDHFWIGSIPVDYSPKKDLRQSYTTDKVMTIGNILSNPLNINSPDYYVGVIDGSTPYGNIIKAGPTSEFTSPPKVASDPDRRSLLRSEWMKEFFKTSSTPVGHGFNLTDSNNGFACYSFVPKSSVPVKVIVLDDTQIENDGSLDIHGHGFLDQARWNWLKKELAAGDSAGQLMIIAAHVPISVEVTAPRSEMGWWTDPQNAVTLPELIAELQSHPNLLMWLSGHRHLNTVKAFVSPDPINAPEKGFWEVETPSLRDFPQQFRTFEIYLNNDKTVSIVTTDVDPAVKEGTPASMSRQYAIGAYQILGLDMFNYNPTKDPSIKPMPTGSYNAELIKPLSPAMQAKLMISH